MNRVMRQNDENSWTRRKVLAAVAGFQGLAFGAAPPPAADVKETLARELRRTQPDFVAYVPGAWDGSTNDSHNEHFLVFDGPGGMRMAVWTQSPGLPGRGQQNRIMFARSRDGGVHWGAPQRVAGSASAEDPAPMASWGFPMVSKSGRIYVVWNQNDGSKGSIQMHTGTMAGRYSDDQGVTWSEAERIEMPASPYDDPAGKVPAEWIVWQIPMRDRKGGYFVGYTHWLNPARMFLKKTESWTQIESVCEFMRFENVDRNPRPKDLSIRYSACGDKALRVPYYRQPLMSVAQEPSLVRLPDQSLFCVMRTNTGYIWYSISKDDGETWGNPRPLLRRDAGQPILQPVSSCPIYPLADGRFLLLHHNHAGDMDARPENTSMPRYPCFVTVGEYRPGADQPVWFSESRMLMDTAGIGVDGIAESAGHRVQTGIGIYTSFTNTQGGNILWYPDRKFFLLGKKITPEFLSGLKAPR
jgi:hypothetical protein